MRLITALAIEFESFRLSVLSVRFTSQSTPISHLLKLKDTAVQQTDCALLIPEASCDDQSERPNQLESPSHRSQHPSRRSRKIASAPQSITLSVPLTLIIHFWDGSLGKGVQLVRNTSYAFEDVLRGAPGADAIKKEKYDCRGRRRNVVPLDWFQTRLRGMRFAGFQDFVGAGGDAGPLAGSGWQN